MIRLCIGFVQRYYRTKVVVQDIILATDSAWRSCNICCVPSRRHISPDNLEMVVIYHTGFRSWAKWNHKSAEFRRSVFNVTTYCVACSVDRSVSSFHEKAYASYSSFVFTLYVNRIHNHVCSLVIFINLWTHNSNNFQLHT